LLFGGVCIFRYLNEAKHILPFFKIFVYKTWKILFSKKNHYLRNIPKNETYKKDIHSVSGARINKQTKNKMKQLFEEKCQERKTNKLIETGIEIWSASLLLKFIKTLKYDCYIIKTLSHFPKEWYSNISKFELKKIINHVVKTIDFEHFKKQILKHMLQPRMYNKIQTKFFYSLTLYFLKYSCIN